MSDSARVMSSWVWQAAGWTMIHYLWLGTALWALAAAARWMLRAARPQIRYLFALGSLLGLLAGMMTVAICVGRSVRADSLPSPFAWPFLQESLGAPVSSALLAVVSVLPWIWICGGSVLLSLAFAGLVGAERLRRPGDLQFGHELSARCLSLARSMDLVRPVAVAVCERVTMPMLVGIVRPLILLPPAALNGWTVDQLEMVLLHELNHVRRWDNLVVIVERLSEALLFFHPAVWFVTGWLRREREFSCDEFVVLRTNRGYEYARMLTELAAPHTTPPWALGSTVGRVALSARVRRILNREEESMHMSRFAGSCLVGCLAAGWGLLIWQGAEAGRPRAATGASRSSEPIVVERQVADARDARVRPEAESTAAAADVEIVEAFPAPFTTKSQLVVEVDPRAAGVATEITVRARGANRDWGPEQAEGPPNTAGAGDIPTAWASQTPDERPEWLICQYAEAIEPRSIVIYETYNPGAVTKISAFDENGKEVEVWTGVDPTPRDQPRGISLIPVNIKFKTRKIKIYIDSPAVPGWNEIDAVGLRDAAGDVAWAQKVEASSTYAAGPNVAPGKAAWSPDQAEGPPDTDGAGDIPTAWASQSPDGQAEWLICKFARAIDVKAIVIHETYNPGAVTKVTAFDEEGKEVEAWMGVDPTPRDVARGVSVIPVQLPFKVGKIKIFIDSPAVPGWNEIDAVGLRNAAGETQWAQKVEASSTFASPQVEPVPARVLVDARTMERLRNLDTEVQELRKEVDRLKKLDAEVQELKRLLKENRRP